MTWNKEEVNEMQTQKIRKNHMDILWHEYTDKGGEIPVTQASLTEKASIIREEWGLCFSPVEPELGE